MKNFFEMVKQSFSEFNEDKGPRLAAALAYYTIFAMAPLLVIVVLMVGVFFGNQAVQGQIAAQISDAVGPGAAKLVEEMVAGASRRGAGDVFTTVIGVVTLLVGASGLFVSLQGVLNTVWNLESDKPKNILHGIRRMLVDRLLAFVLVFGVGLLMFAALAASTAIGLVAEHFSWLIPAGSTVLVWLTNLVISLAVVTVGMATLYKVLPMARIEWRDVWLGAFVTAILFIIGKEALSLYLARAGVGSAYGAAGSLVVLLVWLFYTYQVLIFGAEFTQVHAKRAGRQIVASRGAHLHTREEGACKQRGTDQEPPAAATEPGPEEPPAALLSRRWRRAEDLACIGFGMAMGWLAALLLRRH